MNVISWLGKYLQEEIVRLRMRLAALYLYNDYKNNPELTEFHALDGDDFYDDVMLEA